MESLRRRKLNVHEPQAIAEKYVIEANGRNGMLTTSLRPAAIFGPGDCQMTPGMYIVFANRQTKFQLSDNSNLWDYTYVSNLSLANLLATSVLLHQHPSSPLPPDTDVLSRVDGLSIFITNGELVPFWDFARAYWACYGHVAP